MKILSEEHRISGLSLLRYLCAAMVLQKLTTIALDDSLVQRIYKFKRDEGPDGQYLFNDIEFREGVGNLVSNDIWTGINNLQTFGVIGKFNPSYEKAIIYLSESDAKKILEACDDKTRNTLMRLAASLK